MFPSHLQSFLFARCQLQPTMINIEIYQVQTFKYSYTCESLGFLLLLVLLFLFSASDLLWEVYVNVVYHLEGRMLLIYK